MLLSNCYLLFSTKILLIYWVQLYLCAATLYIFNTTKHIYSFLQHVSSSSGINHISIYRSIVFIEFLCFVLECLHFVEQIVPESRLDLNQVILSFSLSSPIVLQCNGNTRSQAHFHC